jgi:hypothetical protein
MKKVVLFMTSAMLLFAGCAKEELTSEPQEIGFRAYNFKQTKAPIEGAVYGTNAPNFKVFATLDREGNYLTNYESSEKYFETEVAYDATDTYKIWRPWSRTDSKFIKYYWPMSGSLTFVAVSPATAESAFANQAATLTVTDFSSSTTVAEQADLMYSKITSALDLKSANTEKYNGSLRTGVPVVFNHALAQVAFMAENKEASANTIQINKIQITNVANKGTLTVVKDVASSDNGLVDGWKTTTDDATFVSLSENEVKTIGERAEKLGSPLMLIPQTLAEDIKLEVTYSMTQINGVDVPKTTKRVSKMLSEIVGDKLNANKKYTITLSIGADEILFSPSIVPWSETTNVENYPIK